MSQSTEQFVGISTTKEVLFIIPVALADFDMSSTIEELRDITGYGNLEYIKTVPAGVVPPSLTENRFPSEVPLFDHKDEFNSSAPMMLGSDAGQRSHFNSFSNQYFFMQDYRNGINGTTGDGAGISGCGEYILEESIEQSVHRVYTKGTTGTNGKPLHSGSNIKYAYSSGYFGGSAGNSIGGTGGFLEILGTTTDSPYPQGISLSGHQAVKIQLWFDLDGVKPPDGTVFFGKKLSTGTTGGPFYLDYDASTDKLRFNASLGNSGASFNKSVSAELPAGITVGWHHCQVERSNDQLRIFIDGVMKDQTEVTNSNSWESDLNSFSIGAESNGDNSFKGYFSDFHYAAATVTGTDWYRILDGPTGGTMAAGGTIATPAEIGTGDVNFTKLLIPMHGISGCDNFVERGFNIATGKVSGWYNGGASGSTANDTGIRLTVSNIGVTGAATGFSAGYGLVYGFSGTGGTGGVTGANVGGTYGFTGSMASYAISYIPYDDVIGITASRKIAISLANDDLKTDLALGVSGSTANGNNLKWLLGLSGGNTASRLGSGALGVSGAGATGPSGGSYFDIFNFNLTPETYAELSNQATAVEAGYSGGTFIVSKDGVVQEFRPKDVTFLHRDVSIYFAERSGSQQEVENNINAVTDFKDLADAGGKGDSRVVVQKDSKNNAMSYGKRQSDKSGLSYSPTSQYNPPPK